MWVLTKEVNYYDQYGEYFVAGFLAEPTADDLRKTLVESEHRDIDHILSGGGRRNYEDTWWNLYEVEAGKNYYD